MKRKLAVVLVLTMMMGVVGCERVSEEGTQEDARQTQEVVSEEELTEKVEAASEEELTTEQEAPEISVTYETEEDEKELDDGKVYMRFSYMNPTVTISNSEEAQANIQADFDVRKEEFDINASEIEAEAKSYYDSDDMGDVGGYSYAISYSNIRVDAAVISVIQMVSSYMGGAHGYVYTSGLNYDSKTGEILTLDNITTDKEAFLEKVKEVIIEKCDNGEYKEAVFPDYKDYVDGILVDDNWYFDEEGITFLANPYEIAPYASGMLTFTILYDEIPGFVEEYQLSE